MSNQPQETRKPLEDLIRSDVNAICNIYPTVGRALQNTEAKDRLVSRLVDRIEHLLEEARCN